MSKTRLLLASLVALLSMCVTLLIYVPQIIYFAQREYFSEHLINLLAYPLFLAIVCVIPVILLLALMSAKVLRYLSAALLLLAVLLWLQADLFVINFGVLDGSLIDFEGLDSRMYIESFILVLCLVLVFTLHRLINQHFPFILVLVMAGQIGLTAVNVWQEPQDKAVLKELDQEHHHFSTEKNVIVMVLDTFGNEYFEQILNNWPELKNELSGFTYYPDAISNYPATRGSLPSLLTGQMLPDDKSVSDFIGTDVRTKGLPKKFEQMGYQVSVTSTFSWFQPFYPERFISEPPIDPKNIRNLNSALLIDYVLFRAAPQVLKEKIYNEGKWMLSRHFSELAEVPNTHAEKGNMILQMLAQNAQLDGPEKRFKVVHVLTPHPPYVFNADCQIIEHAEDVESKEKMQQQATCAIKTLLQLFNQFKSLGIYDDSVIAVVSDHGSRVFSDQSLTGFPSYFEMNSSGILFMIKGVGQTGMFKRVNQPVSLLSLYDALSDESNHASDYSQLKEQNRPFYSYKNMANAKTGMLPDGALYAVDKNAKKIDSWRFQKFVVHGCDENNQAPITMTFTSNKRHNYCSLFGFGPALSDKSGVWTKSHDARLLFNLMRPADSESEHSMKLTFKPHNVMVKHNKILEISLNDHVLGRLSFSAAKTQSAQFTFSDVHLNAAGSQQLSFTFHDPDNSDQTQANMKNINLGILLKEIQIEML